MRRLISIFGFLFIISQQVDAQYTKLEMTVENVATTENIQGEYIYLDNLGFLWIISDKSSFRFDGNEVFDLQKDVNFLPIISEVSKIEENNRNDKYFLTSTSNLIFTLPYQSHELFEIEMPEGHRILDISLQENTQDLIILSYSEEKIHLYKYGVGQLIKITDQEAFMRNPNGKLAVVNDSYYVLYGDKILHFQSERINQIDLPISIGTPTLRSSIQSLFIVNENYLVFSHSFDPEIFYIDLRKNDGRINLLTIPEEAITLSGLWKDQTGNVIAAWKDDRGFLQQFFLYTNLKDNPIQLPIFDPTLTSITGNDFSNKIYSTGYYNINLLYPTTYKFNRYQDTTLANGNYLQEGTSIRGMAKYNENIYVLREVENMFVHDLNNEIQRIQPIINKEQDTIFLQCTNALVTLGNYLWFSSCSSQRVNYLIKYNPYDQQSEVFSLPFRISGMDSYNDTTLVLTGSNHVNESFVYTFNILNDHLEGINKLSVSDQERKSTYIYCNDSLTFLGSEQGLSIYYKDSWKEYRNFLPLEKYVHGRHINHIGEDELYVFVSTMDFGLIIYEKQNNHIHRIDKSKGLLTNAICGMVKDYKGRYWISTFNGLYVLDNNLTLVKAYLEEDGINHNEFNRFAYLSIGDILFFGGINGYLKVDLHEIAAIKIDSFNSQISAIRFYDEKDQKEEIKIQNGNPSIIDLGPSQNNLFINIASPLDRERGNLIRTKVEGDLTTGWTYLSNNPEYAIGNLKRGDYNLIIQEKGQGLSWDNASTTTISISKSDYFYNHPAFRWLIAALVIGSIFYYFYRRRMQKFELLEMRQQIAEDLHDEIGSVLTGIASKAEILSHRETFNQKSETEYFIKASNHALEAMRDTIWSVNPAHDTLGSLTDRMKDFAFNMLSHRNIPIHYDITLSKNNNKISPAFRKEVYMIFKEAITNILKHARPSQVQILVKSKNDYFQMSIVNDGILAENGDGMNMGIKSMTKRAESLDGKIKIQNGRQFEVNLSCPLKSL